MKKIINNTLLLSGLLSCVISGAVQAMPIVEVTSDVFSLAYSTEVVSQGKTVVYSDQASGHLLEGGKELYFERTYRDPWYEFYGITLNSRVGPPPSYPPWPTPANFYEVYSWAQDYSTGSLAPRIDVDQVNSVSANASLDWEFSVHDEDVTFFGQIINYEMAPPFSLAEISLYDITDDEMLLNLSGRIFDYHTLILPAGHSYRLSAASGDFSANDEDISIMFSFDENARITGVPEPGAAHMLLLGFAVLILRKKVQRLPV